MECGKFGNLVFTSPTIPVRTLDSIFHKITLLLHRSIYLFSYISSYQKYIIININIITPVRKMYIYYS